MPSLLLRSLVVAASFLLPTFVAAQVPTTRPTPEQAQILLQTRPDLVQQLRQRFATSGLTREQIHARLRAEGYPEDLLDAYLPGTTATPMAPTEDVFAAVRALGIADSADVAALQESYLGGVSGPLLSNVPCVYDPYYYQYQYQRGLLQPGMQPGMTPGMQPGIQQPGMTQPGMTQPGMTQPGMSQRGMADTGSRAAGRDATGTGGTQTNPPAQTQLPGQYTYPGQVVTGAPTTTMPPQPQAGGATGQLSGSGSLVPVPCPPGQIPAILSPQDNRFDRRFGQRGITADSAQVLADSGFTIFGLDVFRSATSQFEPALSGPVDANYRLGPGDRLVLIITGDVEAAYDLPVTREGFVVIPQVGQVFVANLTLGELDRLLYTRLSRVYSGVRANNQGSTRYSVSVARLRANQVYVVGDVRRPGSYVVSSAGTGLTALYAAGGPTNNGSLRSIEVRRGGRTVDTLDVYAYLVRGDASHDVRLQTGDVLFVPVHGPRARILGEIARPATYELRPNETLADLLQDAGGLEATASMQRVLIDRILPAAERTATGRDRITIDVSSTSLANSSAQTVPLQNGDVVRVFPVAERVRNRIFVEGNVYLPGAQGLAPGMTLSQALRRAGVKGDSYLGEVLITRLRPDSARIQLRATLVDTTGTVVNDISLQEDDRVNVFSVTSFRPTRFVSIGGAVRRSGRVLYRDGMTLRDLVLLADGVQEGAYLKEAEIARLPEDRANGRTATTIRVPMDSTYLFERGPDGKYVGPPGLQVAAGGAPSAPLKPYDNVLILRQPGWSLQRTVVLLGEVKFPGTYALTNQSERLSDLIKRAGGLTEEAYADGIVFTRRDNNIGRVGVELSTALRRYESSDNLILRDGDNITVPPYNATVTIRGWVNAPSTVAYVRGKGIDYYVDAAGGPASKADEDHAFVTQPSGKLESVRHHFFLPDEMPKPRPGSVVFVPENDGTQKRDWIPLITGLAQIIGSTVAIVVAVTR
jgi:polysaccharide biosynthesis/export protein